MAQPDRWRRPGDPPVASPFLPLTSTTAPDWICDLSVLFPCGGVTVRVDVK